MIEVEIKVRIKNIDEIKKKLEKLGFKFKEKKFQEDIYFNHPQRDFRKTDEALRIRNDNNTYYLTYKGPKIDNISKTREEIEVRIEDKEKMRKILKKLGFIEVKPIKKTREIYKKNDITACIDNIFGLGYFLELEKPVNSFDEKDKALDELLNILKALNIKRERIIKKSYLEMRESYEKRKQKNKFN
ncbi:adenylyl cyclase CyaB [Methanocaldococcus villosus KIN24-T80]|uniref:Adenylyl cyclase CyaB n=1 Tax=Methanocaldococcus villosus KIN24-T80 TaxID=1069083 RepID=N6UVN9_9EURY|nr:class IV adenylate cyclase [Methanocaldococcus villosus]ENN96409.1 adenylyl cyclase CyaB [Methanocaldococcus villosus KIN24-T80]